MHLLLTSPQSRSLYSTFSNVRARLEKKIINSDNDTRFVLDTALLRYIREFDSLLRHPEVRCCRDPSIHLPEVDEQSVTGKLLKRMKKQIKAICVLADVVYIDPPANANEAEILARAQKVLNLLFDLITPPSSSPASDCATDSE
ncbi:unnamed protein product [Auanema sp. JU1783]|nr:unnamed protein product [Auanema sp. JU1783]